MPQKEKACLECCQNNLTTMKIGFYIIIKEKSTYTSTFAIPRGNCRSQNFGIFFHIMARIYLIFACLL